MLDRRLIGCALAALLCLCAARASAADCAAAPNDLPPDVTRFQGVLPADKVATIDAYVGGWIDCLKSGDAEKIKQARMKLTDPLAASGTSTFFKAQYSASLNGVLDALLDPKQPTLVRLNAMIVAHDLTSDGVAGLIVKGLNDKNPAVRYWAAITVCNSMKQAQLVQKADAQQTILEALKAAMAAEREQFILTQMLDGLSCLTLPAATTAMLDVLEQRVAVHVADPNLPVDSEEAALRRLFTQVLSQGKQNAQPDDLKKLARVTWKYMAALSNTMAKHAEDVDPATEKGFSRMAQLGETILPWVITALNPNLEPKLPEKMAVVDKVPWAIFDLRVHTNWKPILVNDLNIANLELPKPPADDAGKRAGG